MVNKSFFAAMRLLVVCGCLIVGMQLICGCREKAPDVGGDEDARENSDPNSFILAKIDDLEPAVAAPDDWPWWRGPTGNNWCQAEQNPPIRWGESENVLWQVELSGRGHATPCIQGDRIFLSAGDKKQQTIWMICLDRDSGDQLWRREVYRGKMPKIHGDNSHASAMPACDGLRVYFPYQTDREIRMAALNMDGEIVWDKSLSPYTSIQGFSASPSLYKSAVIVAISGKNNNKLIAVHRETGDLVWRTKVPADHESYASAMVVHVAGRDQVVLVGPDNIRSYDPGTGNYLWECDGPAQCYVAVAVADEKMVFATGGYPKKALLAIRADGSGNVTETHLAWKSDNKAGYVPSPLLHDGLLYAVSDTGQFRCYQSDTGEVIWEEKLQGKFYSSPVLVGEKIYVVNRTGKGFVLKVGRKFELLAENTLAHGAFATPVICRGRIFLRTLKNFYCLGKALQ